MIIKIKLNRKQCDLYGFRHVDNIDHPLIDQFKKTGLILTQVFSGHVIQILADRIRCLLNEGVG